MFYLSLILLNHLFLKNTYFNKNEFIIWLFPDFGFKVIGKYKIKILQPKQVDKVKVKKVWIKVRKQRIFLSFLKTVNEVFIR